MNKQRAKGKNPVRMTEGEKTLCFKDGRQTGYQNQSALY